MSRYSHDSECDCKVCAKTRELMAAAPKKEETPARTLAQIMADAGAVKSAPSFDEWVMENFVAHLDEHLQNIYTHEFDGIHAVEIPIDEGTLTVTLELS